MAGYEDMLGSGFLAAYMGFVLVMFLAYWVYTSFAYMTIGKKLKHEYPWLAWIPFARTALVLQLGSFHWAWTFLWLVPLFGWIALFVLSIVSHWRFYEKRKYPGWLSLVALASVVPIINYLAGPANLVIIGLVAWMDR